MSEEEQTTEDKHLCTQIIEGVQEAVQEYRIAGMVVGFMVIRLIKKWLDTPRKYFNDRYND